MTKELVSKIENKQTWFSNMEESLNHPSNLGNKLFSLNYDWTHFSTSVQWPPEITTKHIFPLLPLCVSTYVCVICVCSVYWSSPPRLLNVFENKLLIHWVGRKRVQSGGFVKCQAH